MRAEKELGWVILLLDRMIEEIQSKMIGALYRSYVKGGITWDKFCELSEANERMFVSDYVMLEAICRNPIKQDVEIADKKMYRIQRLESLGLVMENRTRLHSCHGASKVGSPRNIGDESTTKPYAAMATGDSEEDQFLLRFSKYMYNTIHHMANTYWKKVHLKESKELPLDTSLLLHKQDDIESTTLHGDVLFSLIGLALSAVRPEWKSISLQRENLLPGATDESHGLDLSTAAQSEVDISTLKLAEIKRNTLHSASMYKVTE